MQVTKKEAYESKSLSEVVSKAESSAREQISEAGKFTNSRNCR
jgi:hypothetical protein